MWPLARIAPADADDWAAVKRGGCNGVFMVVMALSWWLAESKGGDGDLADVFDAVSDVSWVLDMITALATERKSSPIDSEEHPAKRRRSR